MSSRIDYSKKALSAAKPGEFLIVDTFHTQSVIYEGLELVILIDDSMVDLLLRSMFSTSLDRKRWVSFHIDSIPKIGSDSIFRSILRPGWHVHMSASSFLMTPSQLNLRHENASCQSPGRLGTFGFRLDKRAPRCNQLTGISVKSGCVIDYEHLYLQCSRNKIWF